MVGESGTSQQKKIVHRYYKCVSVKNHKGCDKKTVKKDWIEDLTIKMIKQIIFDDKLLNNLADEIIKYLGQESTLLPQLRKQLKDCEKGIDNLLNAIYLYDDKIVFTFNYKDGSKTITMEEIESSALSSDLTSLGAPKTARFYRAVLLFIYKK